jgi:hypothetical protein
MTCAKCIIGGVLQNGSTFSFDEAADVETDVVPFHLDFWFELDTDEEAAQGMRNVVFDGQVTEGTVVDGVITGTLSGQFDVVRDKELRDVPATVETFARRGILGFLTVSVQDAETGRTTFSANVRPQRRLVDPLRALSDLRGTVFLGWDDPRRADDFKAG